MPLQVQKPRRNHLIPEPIRNILYSFNPTKNLPNSRIAAGKIFHNIFNPISEKARNSKGYNSDDPDSWGWHSIRRMLVTDIASLRENDQRVFDKEDIVDFMRWSELDETMFSVHSYPEEELEVEDQLALDREIFEKHPFF